MLFIQLTYFCFSHYNYPTNSVAPFSLYKPTQKPTIPQFALTDEVLMLETSALKLLQLPIYVIASVDNTN